MFPGEEKVGSIKVQHKYHIPKFMSIAAVSRPDESRNFAGMIGIWRVCVLKEAQFTTARRTKGEGYEYDMTIDHVWYENWYTETLLPTVKQKMPWLRHEDVTVQQDGATPPHRPRHTKQAQRGQQGRGVAYQACHAARTIARPQRGRSGALRVSQECRLEGGLGVG